MENLKKFKKFYISTLKSALKIAKRTDELEYKRIKSKLLNLGCDVGVLNK